jgi:xylulokinase
MLLAVDVGTTVLKAGLFGRDGTAIARAERPLVLLPDPDPVRHETDARGWIRALREATGELGLHGGAPVEAVVVSGNNPTLVPSAADGAPLANAITWMDRRATEEARWVSEARGCPTDASHFLPKALWLQRNRPDVYDRSRWLFSCPEHVVFTLTGTAVTFLPTPQYTRSIMWDAGVVRRIGLDPDRFPPFLATGARVGMVTAAGAAATGIPEGSPVFAGAPDYIVALLGTGTVAPGRACLRAGTSEGVNLCSPREIDDARLMCVSHVAAGCWNVSGFISTSGKALEWFMKASGGTAAGYERLFEDVAKVPAGADRLLFLPYLAGERSPIWDPDARGAFIGLTLNHGTREMSRAVVESVAYAVRDVIEVMEEAGAPVRDLRITGRPSRSPVWNQIKADVTGRRILVPAAADPDLAGDACLALYGLGEYDSIAVAADSIARMGAVFEPDPRALGVYDEMFPLYRETYRGLRSVFTALSHPPAAG